MKMSSSRPSSPTVIISFVFTVITYWLTGFHNSAKAFFMFIMWIFLDLLAAESLVVLMSSLVPIFVVALALVAFGEYSSL